MSLGSGYRYLMESVAKGDGAPGSTDSLTRYYAESSTRPGVFLGAGLAGLAGGEGVLKGSTVTEERLFRMLGMCADPITGAPLGRLPNNATREPVWQEKGLVLSQAGDPDGPSGGSEITVGAAQRSAPRLVRAPVAGFDLTFSVSKSISVAWAAADADTKAVI
jgi:TrwC relaxase